MNDFEAVEEPIQTQLTPGLHQKMKAALGCIHKAGYVHGDCKRDDGMVFVLDLESCQCRPSADRSDS